VNVQELLSRLDKVRQSNPNQWTAQYPDLGEDGNKPGIYAIINYDRGVSYIGSSAKIKKRWREHITDLRRNRHPNQKLQRAWNKYGEENFYFTLLEVVNDKSNLIEREQYWLDKSSGNRHIIYNINYVAESSLGRKASIETREKMSAARKGKKRGPFSPEHRKNISLSKAGKKIGPMLPEIRVKHSAPMIGNKNAVGSVRTEEQKARYRGNKNAVGNKVWVGRKHSKETRIKMSASQKKRFSR